MLSDRFFVLREFRTIVGIIRRVPENRSCQLNEPTGWYDFT